MTELTSAIFGHPPKATKAMDGVCLVNQGRVGDEYVKVRNVKLKIEVMVGHVHPLASVRWSQTGRALDIAGEVSIRRRKGGLPDLRKLIHQPREAILVGLIIHENESSLASKDDVTQRRPVV